MSRSDQLLSEAEDEVEVKELRSGTTNRLSFDGWSSTAVGRVAGTMGEISSAGKGTISLAAVGANTNYLTTKGL